MVVADTADIWEEVSKAVTSNTSREDMAVVTSSNSNSRSSKPVDTLRLKLLPDMVPLREVTTPTLPLLRLTVLRVDTMPMQRLRGLHKAMDRMVNSSLEWIPTHTRRECVIKLRKGGRRAHLHSLDRYYASLQQKQQQPAA